MSDAILWPVVAQVVLTAAVWVRMYVVRIREMRARHIDPQVLATSAGKSEALHDVAPADNFRNLFEVPVLFYAVCLLLLQTGHVTSLQVLLAWTFVGLRVLHSFVHLTYNRVMHRFYAYLLSTLCVFAMWILFVRELAQ